MKILHVTPHLPPDQAANALLPAQLGAWAAARGDQVRFVAHPPSQGGTPQGGAVTWIPRTRRSIAPRVLKLGSLTNALRIRRSAARDIDWADVVHLHSNGLLPEIAAWTSRQAGRPTVLTLYGTEIWHYRRRGWPDLFTRMYQHADAVTFYSGGLLEKARAFGLDRPGCEVVYPPVSDVFVRHDVEAQQGARRDLGLSDARLLVNVKRLHPLAGQQFLIDAMPAVLQARPGTRLVICGTGALLAQLQARARAAGVEAHVTFAGLVDNATVARYCAAADLFVLPSLLEALPTVAVEALASGTPVLSSDNPGGEELHALFGEDVRVVPRESAAALSAAVCEFLERSRRTQTATDAIIESRFRRAPIADRYWQIYNRVSQPR